MHSRLLLRFILLVFLVSGVLLTNASHSDASPHSALQGHVFQSSGQSLVIPHETNTATLQQTRDSQKMTYGTVIHHVIPNRHTLFPALKNVISVPPPTTSDPTAVEGIPDSGTRPSDSNGAGGSMNYFETVNHQLSIYSRSGTLEFTSTFDTWFGFPSGFPLYDPNVVWDDTGSRFIFDVDTGASLLLSVAEQSNALGKFCNYKIPAIQNSGADFDKLGVNNNGVYLSVNFLSQNGSVTNNELFFASRTQLENCANVTFTHWTGLTNPNGSLAQTIVPSVQDSSTGSTEYLVNSYPNGDCKLTLWRLTNGTNLTNVTVSTECYSPPPPAPEAGSSATINPGDSSLSHASLVNGLLTVVIQGSYDWNDGNGPVGIVEWIVLNPVSSSVFLQGAFGTPGVWLFYPAAVRNSAGHMLFVYDASGPAVDPSVWYVNQTFSGSVALVQSNTYYQKNGEAPWGDYSSAWLDASGRSPNSVWITGMYAKSPTSWGTKFGLVSP